MPCKHVSSCVKASKSGYERRRSISFALVYCHIHPYQWGSFQKHTLAPIEYEVLSSLAKERRAVFHPHIALLPSLSWIGFPRDSIDALPAFLFPHCRTMEWCLSMLRLRNHLVMILGKRCLESVTFPRVTPPNIWKKVSTFLQPDPLLGTFHFGI